MIIPQLEQDLATIKVVKIQVDDGCSLSESYYEQFLDVMIRLNELKTNAKKAVTKE